MNIKKFHKKYSNNTASAKNLFKKWAIEKQVDDFLGTSIFGGIMIGDLLIDDGLNDRLSPDVYNAFSNLMGDKANTFDEIRNIIVEKSLKGEASLDGLLNKIQGQLGENSFIENVGSNAKLATDGAQEGWDVSISHGDTTQFVQVKIYKDPNKVIEKIQEVNEKIEAGKIEGISEIDFAVNSDIFEEVKEKAIKLALENKILDVGATRDDIRGLLESNFENLENFTELNNFFSEMAGAASSITVIHGIINAFFVWKGSKDAKTALEDTAYSSAISTGGVAATLIAEDLLWFAGPLAGAMGVGIGIGTRSVLKRLSERRFMLDRLEKEKINLKKLCLKLS